MCVNFKGQVLYINYYVSFSVNLNAVALWLTIMTDVPQTDVSRPSALPTANLSHRGGAQSIVDQNSAEYLDGIEEEWNKKVDMEVETLVDGMVDLVSLASVRSLSFSVYNHPH